MACDGRTFRESSTRFSKYSTAVLGRVGIGSSYSAPALRRESNAVLTPAGHFYVSRRVTNANLYGMLVATTHGGCD